MVSEAASNKAPQVPSPKSGEEDPRWELRWSIRGRITTFAAREPRRVISGILNLQPSRTTGSLVPDSCSD
ncbi:uncharacterized protein L3040_000577 [Drepanopeziza brunnea f. sp. 'multigermtubi']|uniref:uncharacterized protein n=1 Tax=Drepanopeziza brunnea f. sp. 'multigermtubi' TaxID=698441 RepID=UPI0023A39D7D|nr:hypothetical protein L3040_000577 [Drepanopeziza brunnea f. sp. 'multigermtubi']